jgi:DNA-binding CsgD family transcriptional regulator
MDYKKFNKKELVDILDLVQHTVMCKTESDLAGITTKVKDLVCAEYGVCGLGETDSGRLKRVLKIINVDYPVEWLTKYAAEGLYDIDPVIRYNYSFLRPHMWKEAISVFHDEPNIKFMNLASEFGLRHGVASGISKDDNRASIFSFSSGNDNFRPHHKDILDILTPHIHQALTRVCEIRHMDGKPLSGREKEVLNWMKEGKTNWEISVILGISERTVKFHVQNITGKLNAVNKAHAVAIAMDSGLVDFSSI